VFSSGCNQGRRHKFEGGEGGGWLGRSMHWKVGVNKVKTPNFEKGGGA